MPPSKKRIRKNKDELHQEEASAKHSSLVAMSTKSLHKEAKVVKSFECQKIVRKIKALKESSTSTTGTGTGTGTTDESSNKDDSTSRTSDEKTLQKLEKLNEKLTNMKEFDFDQVVSVALRRLGLQNEPKKSQTNEKKKNAENDNVNVAKAMIDTMIKHKRMASAMQSISEKVSEYNAWLSRREEWLANGGRSSARQENDAKKGGKKRGREVDVAGHDGNTGLFIESLAGTAMPQDGHEEVAEGYEDYEQDDAIFQQPKKKNRQGQRARKAKTMAIEARKTGKVWDSSSNWREKKIRPPEEKEYPKVESASGLYKSKDIKVADVANMGKNWKEEGKAHPSWAAREAQKAKSGIVAFAGKKITFD